MCCVILSVHQKNRAFTAAIAAHVHDYVLKVVQYKISKYKYANVFADVSANTLWTIQSLVAGPSAATSGEVQAGPVPANAARAPSPAAWKTPRGAPSAIGRERPLSLQSLGANGTTSDAADDSAMSQSSLWSLTGSRLMPPTRSTAVFGVCAWVVPPSSALPAPPKSEGHSAAASPHTDGVDRSARAHRMAALVDPVVTE